MSFPNNLFKINMLSAGVALAILQPTGIALAQNNQESIEEVVVMGFRQATVDSINTKRNAGSVVDAISATDIGKLPDATIADSLQRVPGIQITRSGGEGAGVNIRGNSNVTTTLNGEQMLSAGSLTTVSPNFADVPSTMVSGIEVFKSAEAKNVVAGLAGTINLKTNRPFLLDDGITALGKLEAIQGSLGKETDGVYSGFFGYNNDNQFGASLNLSHGTSYLADYWNGYMGGSSGRYAGWGFSANEANSYPVADVDINGDGDSNDSYYVAEGHQAANRFIDRERTGINGSVQFQINDALELTGDVFYTKLDEHTYSRAFQVEHGWSNVGWTTPDASSVSVYPNMVQDLDGNVNEQEGSFYTMTAAMLQARRVIAQSQTTAAEKESLNTNLELSFDNGEAFTGKLRWVHGEANDDWANSTVDSLLNDGSQLNETYRPREGDPTWANPGGYAGYDALLPDGTPIVGVKDNIPVGISYSGGKQHWTLPGGALPITGADGNPATVNEVFGSNLDRYGMKSTNLTGTYSNAEMDVFRADAGYEFGSPVLNTITSVDVGLRYSERDVEKNGWIGALLRTNEYGDAFIARWKDMDSPAPITGESYVRPISFTELNTNGMISGTSDFYGTTGLGTIYFVDPEAMDDPIAWHKEIYGQHLLVPNAATSYDIKDETATFYVQANLEQEIWGRGIRGNLGLRYLETEYTITQSIGGSNTGAEVNGQFYLFGPGMEATIGDQVTAVNQYEEFLPAINLSMDLTENQLLRFSYTKTIGTHDTDNLGGGLSVNRTNGCGITRPNGGPVACATSADQRGNPYLLPNLQNNVDLSYEWYINDSSMLSLGVFWVQGLTNTKRTTVLRNDIPDDDGVARFNIPVTSTVSFDEKGDAVEGLEIGYKQSLDFLPGFWSGFGIDTNFTYSPSESTDVDYYGDIAPAANNSKYQSNFALWYEMDGLQARIAHNYRSKMYVSTTTISSRNFSYYQKPTHYIDASLSYEFTDYLTVALQITNLTEEYQEYYNQWESNIDSAFYNERRTSLSLQVKY